jgi:hypothetical protein
MVLQILMQMYQLVLFLVFGKEFLMLVLSMIREITLEMEKKSFAQATVCMEAQFIS